MDIEYFIITAILVIAIYNCYISVYTIITNRFSPSKIYFDYFQVMDMSDKEVEQLARHLGHDAKTHKDFYRLAHSTIELSKVSVA